MSRMTSSIIMVGISEPYDFIYYKRVRVCLVFVCLLDCLMVYNTTFNNISDISYQSVLLVEETEEPTTDLLQVTDKLYHIMFCTSP